jgi:hypothetical protein
VREAPEGSKPPAGVLERTDEIQRRERPDAQRPLAVEEAHGALLVHPPENRSPAREIALIGHGTKSYTPVGTPTELASGMLAHRCKE